ncbi:hypothetical protein B2_42 [Stenotrophomonas phage B2]|nr:hypothetical protein B2_42 [Stenotrophomonas phage B2]
MLNIPNLLNIALGVIGGQEVRWRRFKSREQNGRGEWIATYDELPIFGNFQPLDLKTIKTLELDVGQDYHVLYTSQPLQGVNRGTSPDLIVVGGAVYEILHGADWYHQNGWTSPICVRVTDEPKTA